MLSQAGVEAEQHIFPDHHSYTVEEITFSDNKPVLMTEKDAVKCHTFATQNCWYLELEIDVDPLFVEAVTQRFLNLKQ